MKSYLSITLLLVSTLSYSQSNPKKQKEMGITVSRFSFESIPFDLVYKVGREDKLWRFEAGNASAHFQFPEHTIDSVTTSEKFNSAGLGFRIARERRKKITEKLTFYRGIEFGISSGYSDRTYYSPHPVSNSNYKRKYKNLNIHVSPHLGYSFGAIFTLTENLYTSFELSPSMYYQFRYEDNSIKDLNDPKNSTKNVRITQSPGFSFTQGAVSIGLFYRI